MKIGIMGGTFDPIHMGHLIAAEQARDALQLTAVRFMPTNDPPHKPNAPKASARDRLEMVRLAIAGHSSFEASDLELRRGGTSYTFDTITAIKQAEPEHELHYIIGADMVMYLPKWYRIEELAQLVTFVGLHRPGYELELETLPPVIRESVRLVDMPEVDLSSTTIRALLASGRSIRYLVPPAVESYIKEKRLYDI